MRIRAVSALAVLAGLALGGRAVPTAQEFDLVILNGRAIDPESGLDAVRALGIRAGKIAAISEAPLRGTQVIDAAGLVVAPGFIDLHAHGQTPDTYRLEAQDGVTTALELEVGTGDVDGWYAERKAGRLINYGVSIGHIPVRMRVLHDPGTFLPTGSGAHGAASAADVKEMARRLEDGLKQGAVSLGAGFVYTPAATREELLEVFAVAARTRTEIHAHVRSGLAGVDEALAMATSTNAPLHIVHLNSTCTAAIRECLQKITEARGRGLDVTTEAYPYTAGMTEIQSANLDSYEKGPDERLANLEWPRTGERLTRETFRKYRQMGGPVITHSNTEEMVAAAINSPLTMIASDAYWVDGTGHPRTSGTYSKVLGRFVRVARSLTLVDALRKMTLMPAQRLEGRVPALRDKGRVRVGADADLTIFDPARVIDRSTYREPTLQPDGIRHVIVNGVAVVSNGKLVPGVSPGRAVRAPTSAPPLVVDVWPGQAPDDIGGVGEERSSIQQTPFVGATRLITNVTKPTLTIYRPPGDRNTGTAMIIAPGGGYRNLFWELEGEEVAAWLVSEGMTGIILKYRVPFRKGETRPPPGAIQDAQRAVSLVRSRAAEWGINPQRIGIVGFSAGGHLAIATATNFDERRYKPIDDVDRASSRPDFAIGCYSGYLKADDKDEVPPHLRIAAGTPPIFLAHASDDDPGRGGSSVENSVIAFLALQRAKVPTEMHIYASGNHDFGVRQNERLPSSWPQLAVRWLRSLNLLTPESTRRTGGE